MQIFTETDQNMVKCSAEPSRKGHWVVVSPRNELAPLETNQGVGPWPGSGPNGFFETGWKRLGNPPV